MLHSTVKYCYILQPELSLPDLLVLNIFFCHFEKKSGELLIRTLYLKPKKTIFQNSMSDDKI